MTVYACIRNVFQVKYHTPLSEVSDMFIVLSCGPNLFYLNIILELVVGHEMVEKLKLESLQRIG